MKSGIIGFVQHLIIGGGFYRFKEGPASSWDVPKFLLEEWTYLETKRFESIATFNLINLVKMAKK